MNLHAALERKKAQARADGRGYLLDAHVHCAQHRSELARSNIAGCFYCRETFAPTEIDLWIDNDDCALCPRCGIDAVIGDASGFPVADKTFLQEMNEFWF
jgi:hypothetical protein